MINYILKTNKNNETKKVVIYMAIAFLLSVLVFPKLNIQIDNTYLVFISSISYCYYVIRMVKKANKQLKNILIDDDTISFTFQNTMKDSQTYNVNELQFELEGNALFIKEASTTNLVAEVFRDQFEADKQWEEFMKYLGQLTASSEK